MSLRRVDARFLLPQLPSTAVVLGELEGWREGLADAAVPEPPLGGRPELVVGGPGEAERVAASGAPLVLVEGGNATREFRRAGYEVRRWAALPAVERPEMFLPLDQPAAARYALRRWMLPDKRVKQMRNRVVSALVERGIWPQRATAITVGVDAHGAPALVDNARSLGVDAAELFVSLEGADDLARGVLHLFARGSAQPDWVLKFARVPGHTRPFDLDERGLELAARIGGSVTAHAPRLVGRFKLQDLEASVETAARGERMVNFLKAPGPRARKLEAIEAVARWIVDIARETRAAPATLDGERTRLKTEVIPAWGSLGVDESLVDSLPPLPSVMRRGDLGAWNLVVDGAGFTAVDWETAHLHGFPLWDLLYFLTDALAHFDGAWADEARDAYARALFRGDAPSSEVLFDWVRRAVQATEIPHEAVGSIATLCWLSVGLAHHRRGEDAAKLQPGARVVVPPAERIAALWMADPELGPGWARWRTPS